MSSVKDIFRSSPSDSDESFEGFSTTEMTKMKKTLLANGHRSSLELGILESKTQPNQELVLVDLHRKMTAMPMVGLTDRRLWLRGIPFFIPNSPRRTS